MAPPADRGSTYWRELPFGCVELAVPIQACRSVARDWVLGMRMDGKGVHVCGGVHVWAAQRSLEFCCFSGYQQDARQLLNGNDARQMMIAVVE